MNIKERLKLLQEQNKKNTITIKEDYSSSQFFQRNEDIENFIVKSFNNDKNFILLCDKNCNKDLVTNYFKGFIHNIKNTETLQNIADELEYSIASKVIIPSPLEKDIINILKLSLNDFKTFMFALNSKSYENIIDNLTVLISIELPNLKLENIEHLIGTTESIVVYVSTDNDGMYYIKNIGEIAYNNKKLSLNTIYSSQEVTTSIVAPVKEEEIKIEESVVEIESQIEKQEEVIIQEETIIEEVNITQEETKEEIIIEEATENKNPTNKYKLLKEKIQRKKNKIS